MGEEEGRKEKRKKRKKELGDKKKKKAHSLTRSETEQATPALIPNTGL